MSALISQSQGNQLQQRQHLHQQDAVLWYHSAQPPLSSADIVARAYADAIKVFKQELTADDRKKREWIDTFTQCSIEDVYQVVGQAKQLYDDKIQNSTGTQKKARKWLDKFADCITYYGGVLDVLVQYDPAHAGLVWGALKFMFMGVLNHAQQVKELSKALAQIGRVLPRTQVDATLYNNMEMRNAMSRLYAHILLFLQKALKWYTMGTRRRMLASVTSPYDLSVKDTVKEIQMFSEEIEKIAGTSSRAEVRGLSLAVEAQAEKQKNADRKLDEMRLGLSVLQAAAMRIEIAMKQNLQYSMNNRDLSCAIKIDTEESRLRICDMQQSMILKALRDDGRLPEDTLQLCQTFATRRVSWRHQGRDTLFLMQKLSDWATSPGSSVLIVQAHPRAKDRLKDMAVEVVTHLKMSQHPVFFCISDPRILSVKSTLSQILRSLVFQALRHDPNIISQDPRLGNIRTFEAECSLSELVSLTMLVFSKIKNCFIVVDLDDLFRNIGGNLDQIREVFGTFDHIVGGATMNGTVMKLLLVSCVNMTASITNLGPVSCIRASIGPPLPASRRSKMPVAAPFQLQGMRKGLTSRSIRGR